MPNDGSLGRYHFAGLAKDASLDYSSSILIKGLEERGTESFGEQLSSLGIQVRTVNKRGFRQFSVLKRQQHENTFPGGGLLNFF